MGRRDWDQQDSLEKSIQDILSDARSITNMVNKTISQYQAAMPKRREQMMAAQQKKEMKLPDVYADTNGYKTGSILKTVFGGIVTALGTVGFLATSIVQMVMRLGVSFGASPTMFAFTPSLLGIAAGAGLLYSGVKGLGRVGRFSKYRKALGVKTYGNVKDLARAVGKSADFVKKDISYMIKKGWFLEGHTDADETTLITSDATFLQYQSTKKYAEEKQRAEEESKRMQDQEQSRLTPEVREVLRKGNAYLNQIRKCNDEIPGEEISAKISKMEQIVDQIFRHAKEHPEVIPDLKRMMDYYLPTAIKLLEAYADMDGQPYQGDNVQNSKQDIEQTIDTLNTAFEKLMDSVFQERAWDVASDISVLNTILAQEGLTEDGMMRMQ